MEFNFNYLNRNVVLINFVLPHIEKFIFHNLVNLEFSEFKKKGKEFFSPNIF